VFQAVVCVLSAVQRAVAPRLYGIAYCS
jgi:hypothetical protein